MDGGDSSEGTVDRLAARLPLPTTEQMTPNQRRIYEDVVNGPRGRVIGPLRAVIHSPELAERWSPLGEYLRYGTQIPPRQKELAILVTARRWTSQVEWFVHAEAARTAGLPEEVIDAIKAAVAPTLSDEDDALVYEYTRQLQQSGSVDIDVYRALEARWGAAGLVELTALIGYYTMVSMMLNAHEIPLPEGEETALSPLVAHGLTALPSAVVEGLD